jgi:hypothetical protein
MRSRQTQAYLTSDLVDELFRFGLPSIHDILAIAATGNLSLLSNAFA